MTADPVNREALALLTRPIIGIENRSAQEAFDIMADRIKGHLSRPDAERAEGRPRRWPGADCPNPDGCVYCDQFGCPRAAPPPPTPSSTGGEPKTIGGLCDNCSSHGMDLEKNDEGEWLCGFCRVEESALSRPQPVAETVEAREFIENWFAPWGSWKTAWWEMAVSDDVEMTDANALKALRKILAALRPSAHGEAG